MRRRLRGGIGQCCLLAVLAAALVVFLPEGNTFNYRYTVGTPWFYDLLDAQYNFPIRKSEAQVKAERDSVLREFVPYFTRDSLVCVEVMDSLNADFEAGKLEGFSPYKFKVLLEGVEEVYGRGVMDNAVYLALVDSGYKRVQLVEGVRSQNCDADGFYTTRSAYSHLVEIDSARLATVLRDVDISVYLKPNIKEDAAKSREARNELLSAVSYMNGMVQKGEKIIDRGEIVTKEKAAVIESYRYEMLKQNPTDSNRFWRKAGQGLYVYALLLLFFFSLRRYHPEYLKSWRMVLLTYVLMILFPAIATVVEQYTTASALIVPFAMVPIFVRIFLDSRMAYLSLFVTILIAALGCNDPLVLIVVEFVAGVVGIYSIGEFTSRSQILRCTLYITFGAWIVMLAYDLSNGSVPDVPYNVVSQTFGTLAIKPYVLILIGGVFLLFAYPLLYLLERLSGFTSSLTLIEISNINTPLLRRLSKEAQGTFNHSMQVANLVTAVADRIGANVELVRTGALYHDIGKLSNPAFFTENQMGGLNPHSNLPEERSAQIIINHVKDGLDLAVKYHLPRVIKEFIATHHGRSKAKYFYVQYVNKHPGETVNEEIFTYPGPNPMTREQAILMMADSVEAASRSLHEITDETLSDLVTRIVDGQMQEGFFRNCPLTFHDIEVAKEELVQSLRTMYHTRVEYPKLNKSRPAPSEDDKTSVFSLGRWYKRNKK